MNTKVKLVSVKIPEYWMQSADDYHEFKTIIYYYNKIGIKVKYEEVGFYGGSYNAVFWIGKKPINFIKENKMED